MKKILKNFFNFFLLLFVAGFIFVVFANYSIKKSTEAFLYDDTSQIPQTKTAML